MDNKSKLKKKLQEAAEQGVRERNEEEQSRKQRKQQARKKREDQILKFMDDASTWAEEELPSLIKEAVHNEQDYIVFNGPYGSRDSEPDVELEAKLRLCKQLGYKRYFVALQPAGSDPMYHHKRYYWGIWI